MNLRFAQTRRPDARARRRACPGAAFAWLLLILTPAVRAEGPSAVQSRPRRIVVNPAAIDLSTARDRQSIVIQAEYTDGSTRDVTSAATAVVLGGVAEVGDGIVAPKADGKGSLKVAYEGLEAEVPVEVRRASAVEPLRFRNDVMPVLTKAGCNTGKCHGAASGKDGFRLSLFGYDPEGDHFRILRETVGRRVNLAAPEDSLLLTKSVGKVAHTGGMRIEPGSEGYQIILSWLEAGRAERPGRSAPASGYRGLPATCRLRLAGTCPAVSGPRPLL